MPHSPSVSAPWPEVGLLLLACLFIASPAVSQTATLRGFVTDASDGQPLQGVNIVLTGPGAAFLGGVSDDDGFYILPRIPVGTYTARASFIGYQAQTDTLVFEPGTALQWNIALAQGQAALEELVVEADREAGAASVTAGLQTVRPRDIERIPTLDVTGDLATYLTAQPGIVALGDRGGQLFIRGGEPSHNLVLLDGMYVYQPFHILGFYSTFSSDLLRNADIYAGGYGSKYTGRIASVIDVHTRNGNKKAFRRSASFAPFVSTALLEGPLKRDRVSFIASARQSVVDRVAAQYIDQPLPYTFGDVFGKAHAILSDGHQVSFTALYTYDRGFLDANIAAEDEIRWQNKAYGLRYLIAPPRLPILAEVLFSVSSLDTEIGLRDDPTRRSGISGFNTAVNITNYGPKRQLQWGFFLRAPALDADLGGSYQNVVFSKNRFTNAGAYFEPEFMFENGLRVRPGLAGQLAGQQGFFFEPRLRVIYSRTVHEWSLAGGLYRQDVVGLNDRRDATNIFTAWTETPLGASETAIHALAGYRYAPRPGLEASVEGFYKKLNNLSIAEWTAFPRFSTNLQEASGQAQGIDFRLEISQPRYYVYFNYGLSKVRYEAMQESLPAWFNTDVLEFRPPHDRRHQVNVVFSTELQGFDLSMRWNFGSGLPFNRVRGFDGFILMDGPVDVEATQGSSRVIYDRPFEGILPTYHRLDVSVERVFTYGEDSYITIQGGVINTYNRTNLFALDVLTLRQINQLPFIPTLGLKFEF